MLAAVLGGAGLAGALSSGDGDGGGGGDGDPTTTADQPGRDLPTGDADVPDDPLGVVRMLAGYRIVYRVDDLAGDDVVSTERVWARRPFDSRVELATGPPPGGEVTATDIRTFGLFESGPLLVAARPEPAGPDLRLSAMLDAAVVAGRLERRERRTVADRPCDVYRAGGPITLGTLAAEIDPAAVVVDACFDGAGLLLAEETYDAGTLTRRREAVEVDEDPPMDDALFTPEGEPLPAGAGGGGVVRVTDDSRLPEVEYWQLDAPPPGFTFRGRYAVAPAQPETFSDPGQEGNRQGSLADVYVAGVDVVVVDQGGTLRGNDPLPDEPGAVPVDLGALGQGEVVLGLRVTDVRVTLEGGTYVRVYGTLAPDRLVEIARDLRPRPPGTITIAPGG